MARDDEASGEGGVLRGVLSRRGKGTGAVDGAGELAPVDLLQGKEPKKFRTMPGMRGREMEQPEVQKGSGFTGKTTNTAADM